MISPSFTARCDGHPIWDGFGEGSLIAVDYMDCDNTVTFDARFPLSTPAGVAYAIAHLEARGWRVMLNPPDESMDYIGEDLSIGWARVECSRREDEK